MSILDSGLVADPWTRLRIATLVVHAMLERSNRIVNTVEQRDGHIVPMLPADVFRMNLMAIQDALRGESHPERLAIDTESAETIAAELAKATDALTVTLPKAVVERASEAYGLAAAAGRHVEANPNEPISPAQYKAVATAAMVLGDLLFRFKNEGV